MNIAAVIHRPWEAVPDTGGGGILGYWAEDGSNYLITVPYQIRDTIIGMQNALHEQYKKNERARLDLAAGESMLNRLGLLK